MRVRHVSLLPLTVLVAALGLSACNRQNDGTTVGQKIDSAVSKVEQKTDATMAKVEQKTDAAMAKTDSTAAKVEEKTGQMVDAATVKVKDAAITTSINAELAKDTSLSALKINVDTTAGRVALKGTAPDMAAKDRATQLAQKVDGVVGVDNQLAVKTN